MDYKKKSAEVSHLTRRITQPGDLKFEKVAQVVFFRRLSNPNSKPPVPYEF